MAVLSRENVFLLIEMGVYEATLELLGMEMERGRGVYEGTKTNITIADNHNLRGMCGKNSNTCPVATIATVQVNRPISNFSILCSV